MKKINLALLVSILVLAVLAPAAGASAPNQDAQPPSFSLNWAKGAYAKWLTPGAQYPYYELLAGDLGTLQSGDYTGTVNAILTITTGKWPWNKQIFYGTVGPSLFVSVNPALGGAAVVGTLHSVLNGDRWISVSWRATGPFAPAPAEEATTADTCVPLVWAPSRRPASALATLLDGTDIVFRKWVTSDAWLGTAGTATICLPEPVE